jgi:hypothetical protein
MKFELSRKWFRERAREKEGHIDKIYEAIEAWPDEITDDQLEVIFKSTK